MKPLRFRSDHNHDWQGYTRSRRWQLPLSVSFLFLIWDSYYHLELLSLDWSHVWQVMFSFEVQLLGPSEKRKQFEEPRLVSEFSVLDHTQRCLDEIAEERIQKVTPSKVRSVPKAKPKTRRWTRRILSSVSTRSQKRECSGRIPGFYKPKKN